MFTISFSFGECGFFQKSKAALSEGQSRFPYNDPLGRVI